MAVALSCWFFDGLVDYPPEILRNLRCVEGFEERGRGDLETHRTDAQERGEGRERMATWQPDSSDINAHPLSMGHSEVRMPAMGRMWGIRV